MSDTTSKQSKSPGVDGGKVIPDDFQWVSTPEQLDQLVSFCMGQDFVAIDTEFERTSTYFANAGLIQVACADQVWLIDPLAFDDMHGLAPLVGDASTMKVMHSMSEDVELLRHICGVTPTNVFDTQIAASFLGLGPSLGYQKLVESVFCVELDKAETRSDWLQRPLTERQVSYALEDAVYLLRLFPRLKEALEQKQYYAACLDESAFVIGQLNATWDQPEVAYLKLRGAWSLDQNAQKILQGLVVWRDQLSIAENIPKPWVIADAPLIEFMSAPSKGVGALYKLSGIKPKSVKRYGAALIEERERLTAALETTDWSDFKRVDAPLRGKELDVLKTCKSVVSKVEKQTGIPAQLLASRRYLEQLVVTMYRQRAEEMPSFFLGWRLPLLEQGLRSAISGAK